MRHARRHGHLKWINEISITPLLDLVFILLFAFMVAVPMVVQNNLAQSADVTQSAGAAPTPGKTITLSLLPSDAILWDGTKIPADNLEIRVTEAIASNPGLGVILEMSPDLPVSRIVSPMATLQKTGVQSTAIRLVTSDVP
jgi:biopolymer transport protein ExbD